MKTQLTITIAAILLLSTFCSCDRGDDGKIQEVYKTEILKTEKEFAAMARDKGIAEAFYTFADENAVIKRANDTLVTGREEIRKFYSGATPGDASLIWTPDFVDVSGDGMLGYTYGKYTWTGKDEEGMIKTHSGVFHTVWKRQTDGTWRYVWD